MSFFENWSFEFRLIIVLCIAAVLVMVGLFIVFRRKLNALREELAAAAEGSALYEAIVESIPEDKSPVLIFRNAADNATIIHKYKSSGLRKYKPGEVIKIYYNEADDFFMVPEDNDIFKKMFTTAKWCIIGTLIVPIILMVTVIIMMVG